MKISFIVTATAATAYCCLFPSERALAQTVLDEMSVQIESSNSFLPGAGGRPTITIDDLRAAQSGRAAQPQYSNQAASPPPDVFGNASDGINQTLDTDRLIDPVTGSINRGIEGITGSVNNGINRALGGILAPIDGAVDGALGRVNGAIDRVVGNVMAPVDKVIGDLMTSIDDQINKILDGIFGEAGAGGVLDEALGGVLGGVLGGIFGGEDRRTVEALYNPTSPVSSIVSAASFQTLLPSVTAPYTEAIPFAVGSMGLPDYTTIRPTLNTLIAGEQGNPNRTIQGADRFSITPQTLTASLSNEVERLGSRSVANATLSKTGQDAMKADLEGATRTLSTAIDIADESQGFDVTQDIMKNLSAQLAQDSVLRAGQYKEDTLARQQAAADSIVITQISESMDEQNRARRAQWTGNSARMHQAAGQMHLPGEMSDD